MSYKDLTLSRIHELHCKLVDFEKDLSDLINVKNSNEFGFSSVRKVEDSREYSKVNPSHYYCYNYFDSFVEIRRFRKTDKYLIYIQGFRLTNDILRVLKANYGEFEIELSFTVTKLKFFDFSTAISVFESVVCLLTNLPKTELF